MSAYDYRILYGDSSFALRRDFPESWGAVTSVNIAIYDTSGSALLAATAATIPTATTLGAAATRGRRTITVAGGSWAEGDRLRIAEGDSGPAEDVVVESFDSSTNVVTLADYLRYSHASGDAVTARYCTYALDASTTTTWTNLLIGSIVWDPDTDDQAARSTFRVEKYDLAVSGLEQVFATRYPRYYHAIPDDGWQTYQDGAIDVLADSLEPHGGEFRELVGETAARELIMLQIAQLVIDGGGDTYEAEETRITRRLAETLATFRSLRRWMDDDEDLTLEESEEQILDMPLPYRSL